MTTVVLQALTLRCLVSAMEQTTSERVGKLQAGEITPAVFVVILELCNSDTIATQKSALQLASIVVSGVAGDLLSFDQIQSAAPQAAAKKSRSNAGMISASPHAFFAFLFRSSFLLVSGVLSS